jgi:DNA polymerase IV
MIAMRKIIHIDMDAFFASVEQRDNPELRGRPVAVGGGGTRGVVASASYEARKFGVRSAMSGGMARRLCPEIVFVRSRFEVYRSVSNQIREIFLDYTDLVEPLSLDEAYLDVSENKKNMASATLIAQEIRQRIEKETGLTASAGVSFNKFLAKIASDINKPNGIKVITPEEAIPFLEQLPVEKFHGVGTVTARKMHNMGIYKGGDLKQRSEADLVRFFGKAGRHYFRIVRAEDNRDVNPHRIRKSIGAERTFNDDVSDPEIMKNKLSDLAEGVHRYMSKTENFGRTVTLKLKSPDFKILTRSRSFASEIRNLDELIRIVHDLLDQHLEEAPVVRLLGVTLSNLEKENEAEGGIQLELEFP